MKQFYKKNIGAWVRLVDIINCEKLLTVSSGVSVLLMVAVDPSPLTSPVVVNTVLCYHAACD